VTQHWNTKRNVIAATAMHATKEELWEAVFTLWIRAEDVRIYGESHESRVGRESETARGYANRLWWRRGRRRGPNCCKPLHVNAEYYCEIDANLRGREPGSTEAKESTALGVLPGDNRLGHKRLRRKYLLQ
jgi:hypothetical protein